MDYSNYWQNDNKLYFSPRGEERKGQVLMDEFQGTTEVNNGVYIKLNLIVEIRFLCRKCSPLIDVCIIRDGINYLSVASVLVCMQRRARRGSFRGSSGCGLGNATNSMRGTRDTLPPLGGRVWASIYHPNKS